MFLFRHPVIGLMLRQRTVETTEQETEGHTKEMFLFFGERHSEAKLYRTTRDDHPTIVSFQRKIALFSSAPSDQVSFSLIFWNSIVRQDWQVTK